jgi:phosphatidylserine/phosphatidylglycerophosphate/cardiolipin synthase-like enzyme
MFGENKNTKKVWGYKRRFLAGILALLLAVGIYHSYFKKIPTGLNYKGDKIEISEESVDFLYDLTYKDTSGDKIHQQEIFNEIFQTLSQAEKYILLDMFLFNDWLGRANDSYLNLSSDLTEKLIKQKEQYPDLKIDFITDPINTVYGGALNSNLEKLKENGVNVIITDLRPLRDSNPIYSSVWRTFFQWWGKNSTGGWLPNPFSPEASKVSLRSYLKFLNFKANHRKTLLADSKEGFVSIVLSANPHDSSSAHSNVALKIRDNNFAKDLYDSEQAVAQMSKNNLQKIEIKEPEKENLINPLEIQLLTEQEIKKELLRNIKETKKGDKIKMAMFYLSDFEIIKALVRASERGAEVKIILDPNKDAFGYEKDGIPNRQVASELTKKSKEKIKIRWYATSGEQFHTKITAFEKENGENIFILGSANLTRRNINNYNLESNVLVKTKNENLLKKEFIDYFNLIWSNNNGYYTADYSEYEDNSWFKKGIYKIQETSGLSSF